MHTIPCDTRPQIFNKPVTMNKYTLRKITIICKQTRRDPSQNAVWLPLVVFKANAKKSLFICQRAQGECQQWEQRYDCNTRMLPLANLIWTPPSARHVCIKIFLLINTQTSPSHATHSIASDCVTSDLPAASKDSLRTPDVWLDAIHLRHSERYTNVHTGTHTHADKTHKSKQFHSAANVTLSPRHLPGLHLTIVAVTPVHVNQRTHTVRIRDTDGGRAVLINHLPRPLYHSVWECDDQRETKEKIFLIKDLFLCVLLTEMLNLCLLSHKKFHQTTASKQRWLVCFTIYGFATKYTCVCVCVRVCVCIFSRNSISLRLSGWPTGWKSWGRYSQKPALSQSGNANNPTERTVKVHSRQLTHTSTHTLVVKGIVPAESLVIFPVAWRGKREEEKIGVKYKCRVKQCRVISLFPSYTLFVQQQ